MKKYDEQITDKYNAIFPTRLRRLMDELGYTQDVLANKAGVSRQSISQYCTGSTMIKADNLAKIAPALGVSTDYLVGLSRVRSPKTTVQAMTKALGLSQMAIELLEMWNESSNAEEGYGPIKLHDTLIQNPNAAAWSSEMVKLLAFAAARNKAAKQLEANPPSDEVVDETGYVENIEYLSDYGFHQHNFEFQMWKVEQEFHRMLEKICEEQ